MKHISESVQGYRDRKILEAHGDFPSYAHEVAWMLANEFDEPYGFWVRNVQYAAINPGQIRYELDNLRNQGFSKRTKVRMLMAKMKVKVN